MYKSLLSNTICLRKFFSSETLGILSYSLVIIVPTYNLNKVSKKYLKLLTKRIITGQKCTIIITRNHFKGNTLIFCICFHTKMHIIIKHFKNR